MHRIQSDLDLEIFIPASDVIWRLRAWVFWIVVEVCCVQGIFYLKIRFYFGNAPLWCYFTCHKLCVRLLSCIVWGLWGATFPSMKYKMQIVDIIYTILLTDGTIGGLSVRFLRPSQWKPSNHLCFWMSFKPPLPQPSRSCGFSLNSFENSQII